MDVFSNRFSGDALYQLNCCRMFLRVLFLSNMVTADGLRIRKQSVHGIPSDNYHSISDWPRCPPSLPSRWWQQWSEALQICFCQKDSFLLVEPLSISPQSSHWSWHYDGSSDLVFYRSPDASLSTVFRPASSCRSLRASTRRFACTAEVRARPLSASAVTIWMMDSHTVTLDGNPSIGLEPPVILSHFRHSHSHRHPPGMEVYGARSTCCYKKWPDRSYLNPIGGSPKRYQEHS